MAQRSGSKSGTSKIGTTLKRNTRTKKKSASKATVQTKTAPLTGKIVGRSSATGRLTSERIMGPAPGRRTISDAKIRAAVEALARECFDNSDG